MRYSCKIVFASHTVKLYPEKGSIMTVKFASFFLLLLHHTSDTFTLDTLTRQWWDHCLGNTVSYSTFASWLGDVNSPSRIAVREQVASRGYATLLDLPCGLCIDYLGFLQNNIKISYLGMDFSEKLTRRAQEQKIPALYGSIESIPLASSSIDIVYCRHILEHLPSYEKALAETIRVAKKEVLIVFFIKPTASLVDLIDYAVLDGHGIYHNRYSKEKFEAAVYAQEKVSELVWQEISTQECIAHIYLKS